MHWIVFPLTLRNVEDPMHACGIEISHETVRRNDRSGLVDLLWCSAEGSQPRRRSDDGALAEQPHGNLTSVIPTTQAGAVKVPAHAKLVEVRLSACRGPRYLSDGALHPEAHHPQTDPRRRCFRVARPSCGRSKAWPRATETGRIRLTAPPLAPSLCFGVQN